MSDAVRDRIEELRARQLHLDSALHHASWEISILAHYLDKAGEAKSAFLELVPVRVTACIEACLKSATAQLIDHGEPYRSNARKLFQTIKIEFEVLTALIDDDLSLGQIAAHGLTWYDMSETNSRMSAILGFDFFKSLSSVRNRRAEAAEHPQPPIISSLPDLLATIAELVKVRHELCHEVRTQGRITEVNARRYIDAGYEFTHATSWLISETLSPNAPLSQTDMTIEAGKRAIAAEEELARELSTLSGKLDEEDRQILQASQDAWGQYCRAFAELEGNAAKGGTLAPMLRNQCVEAITRRRIFEIRDCLRQEGLAGKPRRKKRWPTLD